MSIKRKKLETKSDDELQNARETQDIVYWFVKKFPGPTTWILISMISIIVFLLGRGCYLISEQKQKYNEVIEIMKEMPTSEDVSNLSDRVEDLEKINEQYTNYENIKNFYPNINIEVNTYDNTVSYADTPIEITEQLILYDIKGVAYVSADLIGQIVLLCYEEGGKEVYFLGKYNENYHWDGYCVTNVYNEDGTLFGICESEFVDGKRINYKSFYQDNDVFIYSDRECDGDLNSGITKHYRYVSEETKEFTSSTVRSTDIQYVNNYIRTNSVNNIKQIYIGTTDSKYYQDESGDAVVVSFDEDGYVTSLYKGMFVNGKRNDDTFNAYAVEYNSEYGKYYLNENTVFKNGKAVNKSIVPMTEEELELIVNRVNLGGYSELLKWKCEE